MPNNCDTLITRALISVFDKSGVVELGWVLRSHGVEILSTGGSARALNDAGISVIDIPSYPDFPEIMDGRGMTLHPKIHGGILARRDNPDHQKAMKEYGIDEINLVVINLHPFEDIVASGADHDDCVEDIDIGGPAMIRAAAKNHDFVTVVTGPEDYEKIIATLNGNSRMIPAKLRRFFAAKAYARMADYDGEISAWISRKPKNKFATWLCTKAEGPFPSFYNIWGRRDRILCYGENSHLEAALYIGGPERPGAARAELIQGKALSYNNLGDADAALELVAEFAGPAIAIVKHANPCGVATGPDLVEAYRAARKCDPVSAFGGVVATNRTVDGPLAEAIAEIFTEVVIAPDADADARSVFTDKENLRLLLTGAMPDPHAPGRIVKPLAGGFLLQDRDAGHVTEGDLEIVTRRRPSDREIADMLFAFRVAKHVKSNAIIYARNGATVGIGAGQMSRLDTARIAARKSEEAAEAAGEATPLTAGLVAASDAFFPFADGLRAVVEAGAAAVVQPGGSVRDDEVVAAADEAGIVMAFTGARHSRR